MSMNRIEHGLACLRDVYWTPANMKFPDGRARGVEKILDQTSLYGDVSFDDIDRALLKLRGCSWLLELPQPPLNDVERRPQFMGYHAQEFVFRSICAFGLLARQFQLFQASHVGCCECLQVLLGGRQTFPKNI